MLKLCLVTDFNKIPVLDYPEFLSAVLAGGITSVQLRVKNKPLPEIYQLALQFKKLLDPQKIPLIINDHVDIALAVDAAGVHLGQTDGSPLAARKILGPDKIIGWSVENLQQLAQAHHYDCLDYIGVGTIFPTQSKLDCKSPLGLNGLQALVQASEYPVVAIGGIQLDNVQAVVRTGVAGIAVIAALHDSLDPKHTAKRLNEGLACIKKH